MPIAGEDVCVRQIDRFRSVGAVAKSLPVRSVAEWHLPLPIRAARANQADESVFVRRRHQ